MQKCQFKYAVTDKYILVDESCRDECGRDATEKGGLSDNKNQSNLRGVQRRRGGRYDDPEVGRV